MMTKNKNLTIVSEIHKSNKSVVQTSYGIVKAHGGEISAESYGKVEVVENEGITFRIILPKA